MNTDLFSLESDRLLVSKVVIKLADISSPLKEKELHVQWTDKIMDEFYAQGDEELRQGLKISDYMDRKHPQVAKLQETFIKNLLGTLYNAYSAAGFLPGILIEDSDTDCKRIYIFIIGNYEEIIISYFKMNQVMLKITIALQKTLKMIIVKVK